MGFCSGRLFLVSAVLLLSQAARSDGLAVEDEKPAAADSAVRTDPHGDALPAGALQRLGTVRFRLEGYGTLHTYFPGGKVLAVSSGGHVRLLDVATGKEIRKFEAAHIRSLAFSPDRQHMAGCGKDPAIRLWDVATGKEVRRFVSQAPVARRVCFSPDGKTLASGGSDKNVVLWDVATGKELRRFSLADRSDVFALDFSPDGKTLAVACDAAEVKVGNTRSTAKVCLVDVSTGKELRVTRMQVPVFEVSFAPDGQTLMAIEPTNGGKADNTIHLWDVASWKHRPLPAQAERVGTAVFSLDSKTLASGSEQKTCLWDVASGKLLAPFQDQYLPASSLAYAPDGKTLATSNGNSIRFWDAATGQERPLVRAGHQDAVAALAFQPDGRTLATVSRDQTLRLWGMRTGKEIRPGQALEHVRYPQYSFSYDGKTLAWCGDKATVHCWDVVAGKELRRLALPGTCVAFSGDGLTLAIGGMQEQPLRLWDLATGKERLRLSWPRYYDNSVKFSPNSKYLAAYSEDNDSNRLRLWDAVRGRQLRHWDDNEDRLPIFTFSSDSRLMVVTSYSGVARVWEMAAAKERFRFQVPRQARALAFSQDGRLLALVCSDKKVYVYEAASGQQLACFEGHQGTISALSFSRNDRVLASASSDTTVLLWDVAPVHLKLSVPETPLTAKELDAFWDDLAADSGVRVPRAVSALAAVPKQSQPLFKERLKLPQPVEPQRLTQLIADLDSDRFAVRQKATEDLEQLAELAAPALQKALEGKPTLETRQRIESILGKLSADRTPPPEILRGLRAIEVLEQIGSKEARLLLETLADTKSPSRLTQEAEASLQRLAARAQRP